MPKVKISMKGIPNDGGVMDIDFFKIDKEVDIIVVNEPDLPYALLKRKLKRMKLKKRDKERIIQNLISKDMESPAQEAEKEAENEEEESEEENNSEDSDQEDEEEEEESDEDAKKKSSPKVSNKPVKEEKKKKEETKEEKYEKLRQEKERKEAEKQKLALNKQKGVLSLIKSKVDDSKNASKISQSLNMDSKAEQEETKISSVSNISENIKKKENDEMQKLKEEQANLFKESLNKTKPYYKDMEKFEVIAEANSNEELSTVRKSIKGGERQETAEELKANIESLAVSKNSKSGQKKDIKASEVVPLAPQESKQDSSQKSKSDLDKRSSINKGRIDLKTKIAEDEEISGILEDDLKVEDHEENVSAEGEESEKEEQSESEPSDQEIEYEKPVFPSKRHEKYFEKIKNKKNFEDKVLLVNFQYRGDYEFFLKKLYYLHSLRPKLLIISYDESEKLIKQYLLNKLSESNDVRVLLVKQKEKQSLIEAMTINIGKKKIRKRVLEGIQVTTKIIRNSIIYSWG